MRVGAIIVLQLLFLFLAGGEEQEGGHQIKFGQRIKAPRKLAVDVSSERESRSLFNVAPFKEERLSRQQSAAAGAPVSLDIGTIARAGERCIDKVVTVEETEYDDVIECKHGYTERCHTTYKTDYEPQQEEECDENYKKNCYIEYKKVATREPVRFCFQPLVRNCDIPGPIECATEYRSECITRYHEHEVEDDVANCVEEQQVKCQQVTQGYTTEEQCTTWPVKKCNLERQRIKKYTPETNCKKVPFQLCGPAACPVQPGAEQCQDREETLVQEVPEEVCNLEPQRFCKHVTKLVPRLEPAENCIDVPKEVCVRSRQNPRRVQKPIVKKWCYTPTKESGLIPNTGIGNNGNNQGRRPPPPIAPPPPQGCAPGYSVNHCPSRAGDRRCDPECNTRACNFDGGDCRVTTTPPPRGCAPGYPFDHCPRRAGDGRCHPECNTIACNYDGGDCRVTTTPRPPPRSCAPGYAFDYCPARAGDGFCNPECNTRSCNYDGGDCRQRTTTTRRPQGCARGYPFDYCPNRAGDGRCHPECNTPACNYDGGDCRQTTPPPPRPDYGYLPPPRG